MIDKSSPIPLYVQLADYLRDMIYTGELANDEKLPTESYWMKKFNLGRATVRAAVAKLENEDIIYKKQGVGTFVKKQTVAPGLLPIISLTYILKSIGITTKNLILENGFIVPDAALKKEFEQEELRSLYILKRMRSAKEYPVAIETSYFTPQIAQKVQGCHDDDSVAQAILADQSIQLTRIRQDVVGREPTDWERKHLQLKPGETVFLMTRWMYQNEEKSPFSYLEFVLPQAFLTYPFKSHDVKNSNRFAWRIDPTE